MSDADLSDFSLLEMFRMEVETDAASMTNRLLSLESDPSATHLFDELMRSAHSLKGAASIVNRPAAVQVAHAMEDCFVAAQRGLITLPQERIDILLHGVDLLSRIAKVPEEEIEPWTAEHYREIADFSKSLSAAVIAEVAHPVIASRAADKPPEPMAKTTVEAPKPAPPPAAGKPAGASNRDLRVTAENLNRLLGLAGESVVASRWVDTFGVDLLRLKRLQNIVIQSVGSFAQSIAEMDLDERSQAQFRDVQNKIAECRDLLAARLEDLELFDRRFFNISKRLYQEVLDCRMRPFSDGVHGFSRMVRDAARSLGKEVKLKILGESTPVDRDVLERVEAPLGHLLRNAADHAIELPGERVAAGKPREGAIRLEARHSAGMLLIEISDDGRGIDPEALRRAVVAKQLTTAELAAELTEPELLEFLFLPGFTMKESVTHLSGRGVGLDVVQTMVKEVGGAVRVSSQPGKGTEFQLRLPLTVSVLRTLLVEIGGEPYAFPLARIASALKLPRERDRIRRRAPAFPLRRPASRARPSASNLGRRGAALD